MAIASRGRGSKSSPPPEVGRFVSPKELAARWRCSRSSVDRIARAARLSRVCLGSGRNGMVRYLREEVEQLESSRLVAT